jgi:hypothetical protein
MTMDQERTGGTAPQAFVRRRTAVHIVVGCPFCGREHAHGAGGGLGLRASHCLVDGGRNYELVER